MGNAGHNGGEYYTPRPLIRAMVLVLRLKYHNTLGNAVADLGQPDEINKVFVGFQKDLYQAPIAD